MQEENLIPLSALNQYSYCPRRCYLIHVEGEFVDNVHTLRGTYEHERVDRERHEVSAGVRVEYALPVWSRRLGLSGKCDAVEHHPVGTVYPVEFKHGKRRKRVNDDLQLAAQALCLEEMLGVTILKGAVYHQQSRRRREVEIDRALRQAVETAALEIPQLLASGRLPPPVDDTRRCPECSLHDICQPELARANRRLLALRADLFEPEKESL
ncbi:MAG: CRISPR-associated protein Cas4 [Acidiferrobacter sp.]